MEDAGFIQSHIVLVLLQTLTASNSHPETDLVVKIPPVSREYLKQNKKRLVPQEKFCIKYQLIFLSFMSVCLCTVELHLHGIH